MISFVSFFAGATNSPSIVSPVQRAVNNRNQRKNKLNGGTVWNGQINTRFCCQTGTQT